MNLRNLLVAATSVIAVAGLATAANASQNISQTAQANATIVQPSSLTAARSLEFGTIALPTSGSSTVVVSSSSGASQTPTITQTSGGNAYNVTSGAARSAQFHLSGAQNDTFTISSAALTISGLTGTATVAPTIVGATGSGPYTLTTGSADVFVGGQFDLTPSTAAGAYTGTVTLNIAYN